jgi:hypothetical protein
MEQALAGGSPLHGADARGRLARAYCFAPIPPDHRTDKDLSAGIPPRRNGWSVVQLRRGSAAYAISKSVKVGFSARPNSLVEKG